MGLFEYRQAETAKVSSVSFDTIIMTAILKADSANLERLTMAFPHLVKEVQERYNNPGGLTDAEKVDFDETFARSDYPRSDIESTGGV